MEASLTETVIAATLTVLANGLGALPFVFVHYFPDNLARIGWAVSGGLMLSASVFNLIMPGVSDGGFSTVAVGIFAGAAMMVLTSKWLDSRSFEVAGFSEAGTKRIAMVLVTLFIHSFPEGLAIGVAYGSGEVGLGLIMAIAIAIHNIPEGLAVALPLRAEGVSGWKCVGWAIFSGVPQLLACVPAYLAVVAFRPVLPYGLGFAAGAMVFMVFLELLPEAYENASATAVGLWVSSALGAMILFQRYL